MSAGFRFYIRDLLWMALLVGVFMGSLVYHYRTSMQHLRDQAEWHQPYQTEMKQAEEKIRDLESRYAALLRKNAERNE